VHTKSGGSRNRNTFCISALRSALLLASLLPLPARAQQTPKWVSTWAMAPEQGREGAKLAPGTLRQIVYTSVAGSEVRIRLSNFFGDRRLRIEDVHIALRNEGSAIVAGSDRLLSFHGRSFVVLPPGHSTTSDPIALRVPALSALAVSFYLPEETGIVTFHSTAHQTSYLADRDRSASTVLAGARTTQSSYFLTGVEVHGVGLRGAVVALGASITEGYKAVDDTNAQWPWVLARRLAAVRLSIGVLNEGISGNRLLADGAGQSAEKRFARDVLDQPGVRWVIFADDPINDLGSTRPPPSASQLIAATSRLIAAAHRHHVQFFCSTLTPYEGANYWSPAEEVSREQFNAWVTSKASGCDAVIDQDRATHDPVHPTRFLPAFDSGDHLHPNDAGHRAIGEAIDLRLFQPVQGQHKGSCDMTQ
jgi:lysophospholipase L1-like esterase